MTLAKCVSSQQSWAVKMPKLTIHAFSSAHDMPIFDPDESARRFCQHWEGIFSARSADIPNDRAETMLAFVQLAPPELRWEYIGLDEFGGIGEIFSSLPTRLACRERLSLLGSAPAEQFSFQSLLKSMPKV